MSRTVADHSQSSLPMHDLPEIPADRDHRFDHLAGVVVLDLTTSIAGPYATMLLADFGARVTKVERPGLGDDSRAWGPPFLDGDSLWFLSVNRNKESVALDYTSAAGRKVFEALVRSVDVVVTNQPPNVQKKLGTDFETLKTLNDHLIYASITGFGLNGKRAAWTCYDLIAEGYSGVMDITGAADGAPQKIGAPAADMLAGQDAALAVMAALIRRTRSPGAQLLDISLVESMSRFLSCRAVPYLGSGETPRRSGGTDSVIAIYQTFQTADDPITLGLGTDGIWRRFWEAVGAPGPGRSAGTTHPMHIADATVPRSSPKSSRFCWENLSGNGLRRSLRHGYRPGRSTRLPTSWPTLRCRNAACSTRSRTANAAFRRSASASIATDCLRRPEPFPPRLGADTESVLNDLLGMTDAEIAGLRVAGAI